MKAKIAALRGGAPAPPAPADAPAPAPPADEEVEVELIDLEGDELADLSLGEILDGELPEEKIVETAETVTPLPGEESRREEEFLPGSEDVEIILEEEEIILDGEALEVTSSLEAVGTPPIAEEEILLDGELLEEAPPPPAAGTPAAFEEGGPPRRRARRRGSA